jgi:uncharacterized membrane protein YcaP (DUF421 family)
MDTIWNHLFLLTIPVLEKIIRPLLVYLFLIIGLRLAGKRELAQLNPFDLVVLLTISNTVQNAIIGEDSTLIGGVIGATTLLAANFIVVRLIHKYPRLEGMMEGRVDLLIKNGKVLPERLKKESIDIAELETAARKQGYSALHEIESASIDQNGNIVFIPHPNIREDKNHRELLHRLEAIEKELSALKLASKPK